MSDIRDPSTSSGVSHYFGYGSNLWLQQMHTRCPQSTYLGVACLSSYRWIINSRGYANVVEVTSSDKTSGQHQDVAQGSYGMVYALSTSDEARLDRNEGVPHSYTKEYLSCDFWPASSVKEKVDVTKPPKTTIDMLVYIDRLRTMPDKPKKEYIVRMNHGIEDALAGGVPEKYVKDVMRKYIPKETPKNNDGGEGKKGVVDLALKQAAGFVSEEEDDD